MMKQVYTDPSQVSVTEEDVAVLGPDGIAVTMTPEAAAETSDRLMHASFEALGKRVTRQNAEAERRRRFGDHRRES